MTINTHAGKCAEMKATVGDCTAAVLHSRKLLDTSAHFVKVSNRLEASEVWQRNST